MTLSCIRCDKQLDPALTEDYNQPYAGTTFTTKGHYGSTFFDPMDGSSLEINICDACLEAAEAKGQIIRREAWGSVHPI